MKRLPVARQILPLLLLVVIGAAIYFIAAGEPDRPPTRWDTAPPAASGVLPPPAVSAVGVVVPSSGTDPLRVRIDIQEGEVERFALGAPAIISPRGNSGGSVRAAYLGSEPLIPSPPPAGESVEREQVRVLGLVYALPVGARGFSVGQQVDAFIPARTGGAPPP